MKKENTWKQCSTADFCTNYQENGLEFRLDVSSDDAYNNWYTEFRMYCEPRSQVSMFEATMLTGIITGSMLFPKLADVAGRKPVFYIGCLMHIVFGGTLILVKEA